MALETDSASDGKSALKGFWGKALVPLRTQERLKQYFDLVDGETEEEARAFSRMFSPEGVFVVDQMQSAGREGMWIQDSYRASKLIWGSQSLC